MRTLNTRALACGVGLLLSGTLLPTEASAQATVKCPFFTGMQSSGCGAIINITATQASVTQGPASGPYDGSDDTLVGIVNNIPACNPGQTPGSGCGINIFSVDLTSTTYICAFDFDGIDTYGAPGNSIDTTGYGGPNAYFSPIPPATSISPNKCRVNFIKPIPPGMTAYFSLENALSTANSPCTQILNNSLKGANWTGTTYTPAAVGSGPNTTGPIVSGHNIGIAAVFVPQGNDPNTGRPYTRAAAAQVCGFVDFDWQQTITHWAPSRLVANCAPIHPSTPPSFNDPPSCGYSYMVPPPFSNPINTYYNYFQSTGGYALATNETVNQVNFYDRPMDSCLPGGANVNVPVAMGGCGGGRS